MILVILGVSILLIILGLILDPDDFGILPCGAGIIGFLVSLIAMIILAIEVSGLAVIDNKIEMYQEENTKIEEQISTMVEQYQNYETEIFTEVKPESSMTLVALYPELKSDTLVQEQIKIHTANNQKIKELKERKINGSVTRWWLYFGK